MENQPEERTTAVLFAEYASLLWRWSWLLILLAGLAGGVSYYFTSRQTPVYQASTIVMVDTAPSTVSDYGSMVTSERLAGTYAKVMTTRPILDKVAERLGLESFPASVQVQPITGTQLMTVTVQDTDPDRAALIANTLVDVFSETIREKQTSRYTDSKQNLEAQMNILAKQIETTSISLEALGDSDVSQANRVRLETSLSQYRTSYAYLLQSYEQIRLAETQSTSTVTQAEPAVPIKVPIRPQPLRSALLSAVVGLMVAAGIIFLIEFLDDSLRDPQEITRTWGIPVLGTVIRYGSNGNGNMLVTASQPRSPVSEAFRALRTSLQFASAVSSVHTLLVTSPSPEDGKTTVVANLATVMAQGGRNTVIVDADLRRPRVHKMFQLSNRTGLTDQFINPQAHLDGSLQKTEIDDLYAITSGGLPPNPSELLGSVRMTEILNQLRIQFDNVLLDTPPALLVTDAAVLASRVDGVLLVVKPSITKRAAIWHAIKQMQQVNANLVGVVINDVKASRSRYYYYRYYYNRKYSQGYAYSHSDSTPAQEEVKKNKNKK